jgi:hypothetical protein
MRVKVNKRRRETMVIMPRRSVRVKEENAFKMFFMHS